MRVWDKIDSSLMNLITFNYRYKKIEGRPQLRLAMFPTISLLVMICLGNFSLLLIIPYTLLFLSSYYEWRLWFKLRK
jgi:hypothetical protein